MKIGPIVLKIRLANTRFENRVAGAAELAYALQGSLQKEMAFVIQLAETASKNELDNGINQTITERFGVVVMLDNATTQKDKTGLTAYDELFDVRAELLGALLGWQMDDMDSVISYGGGKVLGINRAQFWYQFEFEADMRISDMVDVGRNDLEDFNTIYAQWILAPSAKIPVVRIPINDPDMESIIDFTDDPTDGAFGKGFGMKFEVADK
jgi:hypothetical protein